MELGLVTLLKVARRWDSCQGCCCCKEVDSDEDEEFYNRVSSKKLFLCRANAQIFYFNHKIQWIFKTVLLPKDVDSSDFQQTVLNLHICNSLKPLHHHLLEAQLSLDLIAHLIQNALSNSAHSISDIYHGYRLLGEKLVHYMRNNYHEVSIALGHHTVDKAELQQVVRQRLQFSGILCAFNADDRKVSELSATLVELSEDQNTSKLVYQTVVKGSSPSARVFRDSLLLDIAMSPRYKQTLRRQRNSFVTSLAPLKVIVFSQSLELPIMNTELGVDQIQINLRSESEDTNNFSGNSNIQSMQAWEETWLEAFASFIKGIDVNIVITQQRIHPYLEFQLEKFGILYLSRVSLRYITAVLALTGARLLDQLPSYYLSRHNDKDISLLCGALQDIDIVYEGKALLLLKGITNKNESCTDLPAKMRMTPVHTMLIQSFNLQSAAMLETATQDAYNFLTIVGKGRLMFVPDQWLTLMLSTVVQDIAVKESVKLCFCKSFNKVFRHYRNGLSINEIKEEAHLFPLDYNVFLLAIELVMEQTTKLLVTKSITVLK